ncbi:MAG TPA: hypothetical protein VFB30_12500 [Spirochaetia bacterium]|nr:hypothetical protein [Spirochaetia bacterium]
MKVKELARLIDARLHLGTCSEDSEIAKVHASDTMSDLIEHAAPATLLLTSLHNSQLVRVAELMDVPGICLVSGVDPQPELLERARETGTAILVSPAGLEETCRRLEDCSGTLEVTRA